MDRLVVHVAKHSTSALNSQLQEDNNNQQTPSTSTPIKTEAKINVAPLQTLQNPVMVKSDHETPFLTPTFDAYNHFSNFPANLATQFALMSQQQTMQNAFLPQGLYQNSIPTQLMFQHSQLMQSPLLGGPQHGYQSDNMTSPLAAMAANLNKRSLSPHHEISPEQKKARIQNSMRILKDEPVPEGYLRFRYVLQKSVMRCNINRDFTDLMRIASTNIAGIENTKLIFIVKDRIVGTVFAIRRDLYNIRQDMSDWIRLWGEIFNSIGLMWRVEEVTVPTLLI